MEQIKEKHENPTIERVSDSLGVHQPENATEKNGLASEFIGHHGANLIKRHGKKKDLSRKNTSGMKSRNFQPD